MVIERKRTINQLRDKSIIALLKKGIYKSNPEKVSNIIAKIDSTNGFFYIAYEINNPIGIIAVIEEKKHQFIILMIYVEAEYRKKGIGRLLFNELVKINTEQFTIKAETDKDAVGFYHSLAFRIHSLGEKYPGIIRYQCIYDHSNWLQDQSCETVNSFKNAGIKYWISGGLAIDLYLGRQTRIHEDTDISILRKDQYKLKKIFNDWEIYHTHAPGLRYWNTDEYLKNIPNVWLRRNSESPWAMEIMFQESQDNIWIYRRNSAIKKKINEIGLFTNEGIPYLSPEIQLLFKAGGTSYRDKDILDLKSVLPFLSEESRKWLITSLHIEFPNGHDWLAIIYK